MDHRDNGSSINSSISGRILVTNISTRGTGGSSSSSSSSSSVSNSSNSSDTSISSRNGTMTAVVATAVPLKCCVPVLWTVAERTLGWS